MSFIQLPSGLWVTDNPSGVGGSKLDYNFTELGNRIAKCNYEATTDPGTGNNTTQGYWPGSFWLNTSTTTMFQCVASSGSTATWTKLGMSLPIAESDVSGLVADLAGKAATVHTHVEDDVTGLVAALAAKAPLASPTFAGTVTTPALSAASGKISLNSDGSADWDFGSIGQIEFGTPAGFPGFTFWQGATGFSGARYIASHRGSHFSQGFLASPSGGLTLKIHDDDSIEVAGDFTVSGFVFAAGADFTTGTFSQQITANGGIYINGGSGGQTLSGAFASDMLIVDGFTGSGPYTNFNIVNGIIVSAS
jgi:hypothetical protein